MLNMQGCAVSDPGEGGEGGDRWKSGEGVRERGGERGISKKRTSVGHDYYHRIVTVLAAIHH
jgi:hypothetical protein